MRRTPSLVDRLWEDAAAPFRAARAALVPASWAFDAAVRLRAALYDRGVLAATRAEVPVVSVGNLRVGGTGKTPLVLWLAERLFARGVRAAVVSRGYGGSPGPVAVSTDAEPPRLALDAAVTRVHVRADGAIAGPVEAAADEALLVAARTGRPAVTCSDRVRACAIARQLFAPDLILLDDGFQHRRLARDLDIVLVSGADQDAHTLPAGPLRESPHALLRADVVVWTDREPASGVSMRRRTVGLVLAPTAAAPVEDVASLTGTRVAAVAGIARPAAFADSLRDAGADVVATFVFPDHHRYAEADVHRIAAAAAGCDRIVTTEKDLVKLMRLPLDDRWAALRIDVDVSGGDALLDLIVARARLDANAGGQHHRGPHPRGRGT